MEITFPALYELAMSRVRKDNPPFTELFWKKVLDLYISMGGEFNDEGSEGSIDLDSSEGA